MNDIRDMNKQVAAVGSQVKDALYSHTVGGGREDGKPLKCEGTSTRPE